MRYIVKISYHRFEFDDPVKAMVFAEEAKNHYVNNNDEDVDVDIILKKNEVIVENDKAEQEVE